jgi:hypothetical protein
MDYKLPGGSLLDDWGDPVTAASRRKKEEIDQDPVEINAGKQLFEAVCDVATERDCVGLLLYSFDRWLLNTARSLRLEGGLSEKLAERVQMALFDPEMLSHFRPKYLGSAFNTKRNLEAAWKRIEQEIEQKELCLCREGYAKEGQNFDMENEAIRGVLLSLCRKEAIEQLRQEKAKQLGLEAGSPVCVGTRRRRPTWASSPKR